LIKSLEGVSFDSSIVSFNTIRFLPFEWNKNPSSNAITGEYIFETLKLGLVPFASDLLLLQYSYSLFTNGIQTSDSSNSVTLKSTLSEIVHSVNFSIALE
jgi:hypothetical protein